MKEKDKEEIRSMIYNATYPLKRDLITAQTKISNLQNKIENLQTQIYYNKRS